MSVDVGIGDFGDIEFVTNDFRRSDRHSDRHSDRRSLFTRF